MTYKHFVLFTQDANGLEKILRLLQSFSQIFAAYSFTVDSAVLWMHLRRQFSLGRRYFRFFRFLGCFTKAYEAFLLPLSFMNFLEITKWSFMGIYMFMESMTILDAIGVWPTPWAEMWMLEANRFWFYSLVASIVKAAIQIAIQRQAQSIKKMDSQREEGGGWQLQRPEVMVEKSIKRRMVADCFDLLIPGHMTGWIPTTFASVGIASVVSTLLTSKDIWEKLR